MIGTNDHAKASEQVHQSAFEQGVELEKVSFEHDLCRIRLSRVGKDGEIDICNDVVRVLSQSPGV